MSKQADKRVMGTFAVDAIRFVKAVIYLRQNQLDPSGRNTVVDIAVRALADAFDRENPTAPELTYAQAQEWLDRELPQKTIKAGKKRVASLVGASLQASSKDGGLSNISPQSDVLASQYASIVAAHQRMGLSTPLPSFEDWKKGMTENAPLS